MGLPRRVVPGTSYFITRRCYQRTYRLRPNRLTSQIFLFALGLAAKKTGVLLHAVCVMSNHHHCVITDPAGRLPEFLAELHRTVAKALNAAQGQWENLWSAERCNAAEIADDEAFIDRIAYTAANPVAAGLVADPGDWPGISYWKPTRIRVARPDVFFDEHGKCPDSVEFGIEQPNRVGLSPRAWMRKLTLAIRLRVSRAREKLRAQGRPVLGRAAVLSESFMTRAPSVESKRVTVPNVAASDPSALARVTQTLRAFRAAYRDALGRWREGLRSEVFPFGTWAMRRFHNAAVAGPSMFVADRVSGGEHAAH